MGASVGALCLDQDACRKLCAGREDCHHIELSNVDEVCYLRPRRCEDSKEWYLDQRYFALVKGSLPMGCPADPKPTLPPSATTSQLRGVNPMIVLHTPAPGSVAAPPASSWAVRLQLHTAAPSGASGAAIGRCSPAQLDRCPMAWSHKGHPGGYHCVNKLTMQASLVAFQRSEGACRPYGQGPFPAEDCDVQCRVTGLNAARWPGHVAPEPHLTPPGDRWYVHLGKRCVSTSLRPARDRCLTHPERMGFAGSFGSGGTAVCLDVNECMALCDATEGCVAVEMSQAVNRCLLKGSGCTKSHHWRDSRHSNLLVVGRSHLQAADDGPVEHCKAHTAAQCPASWSYGTNAGGYHCLRKLERQTSIAAYLSSDGACRPASLGPFPYGDCHAQCRVVGPGSPHAVRHRAAPPLVRHSALELLHEASDLVAEASQRLAEAGLDASTHAMRFGTVALDSAQPGQSYKYSAVLGSGCSLYLVPFNADHVGIFNVATQSFRTLDIASSQEFKYSAGLIYGRQAFFVPYNADHIAVLDLQTERFRRLSAHVRAEQCKYSAALAHGSSAYLVPSSAEDVGVLDMATESFRSIQLKATGTKWKFRGGVIHGGKAYLAPYNADYVGLLDLSSERYEQVDISEAITGDMKFTDAFVYQEVVYFVPFNAESVGALPLASGQSFRLLQLQRFRPQSFNFWGGIQVGSLIFFVPDDADCVGVFDASNQDYTELDIRDQLSMDFKFATGIFFNGALYFAPRNAESLGMLQVSGEAESCDVVAPPPAAEPPLQASVGDWMLGLLTIALALVPAELGRDRWSEVLRSGPFFRPLALSTISALLYFAVRSTLDVRPEAFWAEPWPASCFFLVLWAFQASLIPSGSCAELAAPLAGWAGVDAGGAWQRLMSGTCLEAAAALMLFQLALLALDLLAGAAARRCHRPRPSPLLAPVALLSIEVLCFGLLGRFDPVLLDRSGLRDGVAPLGAIAALYLLSGVLLVAARLLRGAPEGCDAARLAACWGLLRATRWLQEALELPGGDAALCIVCTMLAFVFLSCKTPPPGGWSNAPPMGTALGLYWTSALLQALHLVAQSATLPGLPSLQALWLLLVCSLTVVLLIIFKVPSAYTAVEPTSPKPMLRRQDLQEQLGDIPTLTREGAQEKLGDVPTLTRQGLQEL